MAINTAYKDAPWCEITYVGDMRLLNKIANDPEWIAYKGQRYTRSQKPGEIEKKQRQGMIVLERLKQWGRDLNGIVSVGNSGLSGVNLAEQLGWSPIFLLGFDCCGYTDRGLMANYHDRYPTKWMKPGPFLTQKFSNSFEAMKHYIRADVYNCNPESELGCFPKISIEEAFEICQSCE